MTSIDNNSIKINSTDLINPDMQTAVIHRCQRYRNSDSIVSNLRLLTEMHIKNYKNLIRSNVGNYLIACIRTNLVHFSLFQAGIFHLIAMVFRKMSAHLQSLSCDAQRYFRLKVQCSPHDKPNGIVIDFYLAIMSWLVTVQLQIDVNRKNYNENNKTKRKYAHFRKLIQTAQAQNRCICV